MGWGLNEVNTILLLNVFKFSKLDSESSNNWNLTFSSESLMDIISIEESNLWIQNQNTKEYPFIGGKGFL